MNRNERLIAEVNGSMAMEGMALTKADKERLLCYLRKPEDFGRIMSELVGKHKVSAKKNA